MFIPLNVLITAHLLAPFTDRVGACRLAAVAGIYKEGELVEDGRCCAGRIKGTVVSLQSCFNII